MRKSETVVSATPRPAAAPQSGRIRRAKDAVAKLDLMTLALAGAILTYVWRIQDLYPIFGSIKLPILSAFGALGLFMMDGDRRRRIGPVLKHPLTKTVVFIMALAVLSVATSIHDGMSFRFIQNDLSKNFLVMVLLAAGIRSVLDVKRFLAVMLLGAFVYSQYVYLKVEVGASGRLAGIVYYDANDLGMLLVSSMPVALFFLMRGRSLFARVAAAVSLVLFMLVIIKTGSRGAFLGLIAMAMYLLFGFQSLSKKVRIFAVVGGFVALMTVGSEQYWSMMRTLMNPKADYNWSGQSETGRMEVWKRGMGYMLDRPITGVGVAAYPIAEGTLSGAAELQMMGIGFKWGAAHNSFVQIGAELGVFGLLAFCLALFQGFRASWQEGRSPPGRPKTDGEVMGQALAGMLIGYIVCGFFLSQAYGAFTFTLYGLIIGLAKVTAAERKQGGARPLARPQRRRGAAASPVPASAAGPAAMQGWLTP